MSDNVILEVNNLKKYFKTRSGMLHAVDDVSFTIERGKTLGIVGESGCGKTTTGRSILRLVEPTSGTVIFDGTDITKLSKRELRKKRQEMQLIFQDPFSSLNPKRTVCQTIEEVLKLTGEYKNSDERFHRVLEIMEMVGLDERLINAYPHEMDGGRRQRLGIGRALAMKPKFIVCDEPVSALDVSIQAQILNMLRSLQNELGLTYIFITHDLSVVNYISDDIAVMYLGRLIEKASTEELFRNPLHPYTKALLSALPVPSLHNRQKRILIKGEISSPIDPKPVCRFAARCDHCTEACLKGEPPLVEVSPNHFVSCFMVQPEQG
ncbi:MAG: ABC transporter ATP-binding protein [Lachnospiraceae bacterium]|nr:ABC transporter ATP-binding protein [Lachnospiraceae bacterium]MBQ6242220.1 ABC transporter ATP-binding protein [Lachnospiraceae bacterium]